MRKLRNILEKRIWILAAVMLTAFLVLSNGSELFQSSMALEQNARCGLTEHVHGEECYYRDILICKEKAHFHNERCYLVLLEENDINSLLIKVDAMPGNSLERLIAQVLDRAIWYGWYGDENLNYITSGGSFASSAAASSAAQLWNQYAASSAVSGGASSSASSSSSADCGVSLAVPRPPARAARRRTAPPPTAGTSLVPPPDLLPPVSGASLALPRLLPADGASLVRLPAPVRPPAAGPSLPRPPLLRMGRVRPPAVS